MAQAEALARFAGEMIEKGILERAEEETALRIGNFVRGIDGQARRGWSNLRRGPARLSFPNPASPLRQADGRRMNLALGSERGDGEGETERCSESETADCSACNIDCCRCVAKQSRIFPIPSGCAEAANGCNVNSIANLHFGSAPADIYAISYIYRLAYRHTNLYSHDDEHIYIDSYDYPDCDANGHANRHANTDSNDYADTHEHRSRPASSLITSSRSGQLVVIKYEYARADGSDRC